MSPVGMNCSNLGDPLTIPAADRFQLMTAKLTKLHSHHPQLHFVFTANKQMSKTTKIVHMFALFV